MGFEQSFRSALGKIGEKKQQDIAKQAKMAQSTLSLLINDPKRDPRLSSVAKIIDSFDKDTFLAFIRELRPDLPVGVINMEGKHIVHVYDMSDLNTVFHCVSEEKTRETLPRVLENMEPLFNVRVPEEFFPSDFGVRQSGHSMEPDLPHLAAIGVQLLKSDKDFFAGEIYLCNLPYEGLVLRRVVVAPGQDALEFMTINKDRDAYRSQIMHPEEAIKLIYARITWVASRK